MQKKEWNGMMHEGIIWGIKVKYLRHRRFIFSPSLEKKTQNEKEISMAKPGTDDEKKINRTSAEWPWFFFLPRNGAVVFWDFICMKPCLHLLFFMFTYILFRSVAR